MMLLYRGSVIFRSLLSELCSRRFCTDSKSEKSDPLHLSRQRDIPSKHSTVQASSVWTARTFCPDLPLCREASNCSKLHPFERRSVFDQLWDFFPKTHLWEDSWNRLDNVFSCSDALLHKASRVFKVQPSGHQSSCFGCSSFIYENCVHQFNRLDDSLHGPDAPKSWYGNCV